MTEACVIPDYRLAPDWNKWAIEQLEEAGRVLEESDIKETFVYAPSSEATLAQVRVKAHRVLWDAVNQERIYPGDWSIIPFLTDDADLFISPELPTIIDYTGPIYEHDCDECRHLATVLMHHLPRTHGDTHVPPAWWDVYLCCKQTRIGIGNAATIVVRRSSDPPDYTSGDMAMVHMLLPPVFLKVLDKISAHLGFTMPVVYCKEGKLPWERG